MAADRYAFIGPIYEQLSRMYSKSGIQKCRVLFFDEIKSGDKVLFAGVGHGHDALEAARRGALVTIVELSPKMLSRFEAMLRKEPELALAIRRVRADIRHFDELGTYDIIVANFFLNVFAEAEMVEVLGHLINLGHVKARLIIGDFAQFSGNWVSRVLMALYYYLACLSFALLTRNAVHPPYDYQRHLRDLGLDIAGIRHIAIGNFRVFYAILATQAGDSNYRIRT